MKVPAFFRQGLGLTQLRVKLLVSLLILSTLGLISVSLFASMALRSSMTSNLDKEMRDSAYSISSKLDLTSKKALSGAEALSLPGPFIVLLLNENGSLIDQMRSVDDSSTLPSLSSLVALKNDLAPVPLASSSGTWHAFSHDTGERRVIIAVSLAPLHATSQELLRINLMASMLILLVLTLLGSVLLTRNLTPLHKLEASAREINAGNLSTRVPASDPSTEVGSLSTALNSMLSRLEAAFEETQLSRARALDSEKNMRRFTADVSHELRTPLTSIHGFSELGEKTGDPSYYLKINAQSSRMASLVDDLLSLARLDQNAPLEKVEVDLVSLVMDSLDAFSVTGRKVDFRFEESVMASVDPGAFRQVVTNLVSNAIKYTGGPVVVSLTKDAETAVLEVSDMGPGMEAAVAEKVFERFFRADVSRSRHTGGTGLGLSIVKSLAEAHGGTVELKTDTSSGSTFTVKFPCA